MTSPVTSEKSKLDPHELARTAALLGLEKKAGKPVVLDLRGFDFLCDYYVVMDGESEPQIKAIVEKIEEGLKGLGEAPWHVEGRQGGQWVLLDYVHVVIHVFLRETRELYLLERLWGDAPTESVDA
jgi:ribosome-associated protein